MNTCRVCKKLDFEEHPFPLVRYGKRHLAHADCALKRDGPIFFGKLSPYQLENFPVMAARQAGVEPQLRAEIQARPYRSSYRTCLRGAD